jgi:ubiquinone/menaquinone biosynthesis C-methylase UbiE
VTDTWELFDRLADAYDATIPFFGSFGGQLVDLLDPAPGTRLLDIGAGRGAIAVAAADRGCAVTAIDPAPRMTALLAAARPDVDARVMDAHALDLPDASYDVATGGFMIHIVEDPERVLAELRRVVRPGGTVAFTLPCDIDDAGRWDDYNALVREFRGRMVGPGRLGKDYDVEQGLHDAGFVDVREREFEVHIPVPDPETYWRFTMSHGFARFVESLAEADRDEFRVRAFELLTRMRDTHGIIVDRGAWVVWATVA